MLNPRRQWTPNRHPMRQVLRSSCSSSTCYGGNLCGSSPLRVPGAALVFAYTDSRYVMERKGRELRSIVY
jgi:hypothetical protein